MKFGIAGPNQMTFETRSALIMTSEALIDDRAEWSAPVLEHFETASAETGFGLGPDAYGES
jgi:hypothetical protein